jgi:hypothetical protein
MIAHTFVAITKLQNPPGRTAREDLGSAKAIPLRLVLPVPTLGNVADGERFQARISTSVFMGPSSGIATTTALELATWAARIRISGGSVIRHISTATVTVTRSKTPRELRRQLSLKRPVVNNKSDQDAAWTALSTMRRWKWPQAR